jgi:transposase-like protein
MFVPRYTRQEAAAAVADSYSASEVLRKLGIRAAGGNHQTLRRWLDEWQISTDHFDPGHYPRRPGGTTRRPLEEYLIEHSTMARSHLKSRLYAEGLKQRRCEMCGQGEQWNGRPMALILDHINGVADDNRLANLRIVCANCNATLDTHCGRQNRLIRDPRSCAICGEQFVPRYDEQRCCSRKCGARTPKNATAQIARRTVERPPYEQLIAEIEATSWVAVGCKYGVSDNAIRKWVRWYEADLTNRSGPPESAGDQDGGEP